jgi:hypothetical protein
VAASLSKDIRARKQTCLTTKLLKKTVFEELPLVKNQSCHDLLYQIPSLKKIFNKKFWPKILVIKLKKTKAV